MSDIIDEFEKLDLNFINEKVNLIRKFVKSKAEYWQQIPKLHLIYNREDEKFDLIVKNKIYPIESYFFDRGPNFCCINCKNAEVVYLNTKLNDYVNIEIDKNIKKSLALSVNYSMLESIDGEFIYNKYIQENKSRSVEIGDEAIELWIMRSIINEIPITLDDFRIHFNNDFGYDEKSFLILYDNCMAKLAGKVLLY